MTPYPLKSSPASSHAYIIQEVGENRRVLDIGCGDGLLAAELVKRHNRVVGVDILAQPSARDTFVEYLRTDLEAGLNPVADALEKYGPFDVILFPDVLEHLSSPERILTEARRFLRDDGRVIMSVPNVANLYVRLSLLLGRFDYADRGILDRTHLRFFTRDTAAKLAHRSGYRIVRQYGTVIPVEFVFGLEPNHWWCRLTRTALRMLTRIRMPLFGYQIVLTLETAGRQEDASR